MKSVVKLKLDVQDFGEVCNLILDAFERGEPDVPTTLALKLVGHIEAVLKEDSAEINALKNRLQTYAIEIDDANKALGWKGIPRPDDESVAHGIERLYDKLTKPTT